MPFAVVLGLLLGLSGVKARYVAAAFGAIIGTIIGAGLLTYMETSDVPLDLYAINFVGLALCFLSWFAFLAKRQLKRAQVTARQQQADEQERQAIIDRARTPKHLA